MKANDRQRSWDFSTLRSFVPARQVSGRLSRQLEPRVSFNERLPRGIFWRGIDRLNLQSFSFLIDQGRSFRLPGLASALPQAE